MHSSLPGFKNPCPSPRSFTFSAFKNTRGRKQRSSPTQFTCSSLIVPGFKNPCPFPRSLTSSAFKNTRVTPDLVHSSLQVPSSEVHQTLRPFPLSSTSSGIRNTSLTWFTPLWKCQTPRYTRPLVLSNVHSLRQPYKTRTDMSHGHT